MRPIHSQRGLADPGRAGDRRDHHHARLHTLTAQQLVKLAKLGVAPGEARHRSWQLMGYRQSIWRRITTSRRDQPGTLGPGERERLGQQADRVAARPAQLG
jgi:hypothetical protein